MLASCGINDIDHHVSLEVRFIDLDIEHRVPRLYVRCWLSELYIVFQQLSKEQSDIRVAAFSRGHYSLMIGDYNISWMD